MCISPSLDQIGTLYGYALTRHRELAFGDDRTPMPEPTFVRNRIVACPHSGLDMLEITHAIDLSAWGGEVFHATCRVGVTAEQGFVMWHAETTEDASLNAWEEWLPSREDWPDAEENHLLDSLDCVCGWLRAVTDWEAARIEDRYDD